VPFFRGVHHTSPVPSDREPVRVHIATTQQVVELGLRTMLERAESSTQVVLVGPEEPDPDIVLFDVIWMREGDTTDLDAWLKDTDTTVIAIDRTLRPELGMQARNHGVEWSINLGIDADDLVQVIEEAASGHLKDSDVAEEWDATDYPGHDAGLSRREAEVLALIVQGNFNQDIANAMFLSINSVKTYIRSGYRKIGVINRAQAVVWGIENGFRLKPHESPDGDAPDAQGNRTSRT